MESPRARNKDFTVYKGRIGGPPPVPLTQDERDVLFLADGTVELDTDTYMIGVDDARPVVRLPYDGRDEEPDAEPEEVPDDAPVERPADDGPDADSDDEPDTDSDDEPYEHRDRNNEQNELNNGEDSRARYRRIVNDRIVYLRLKYNEFAVAYGDIWGDNCVVFLTKGRTRSPIRLWKTAECNIEMLRGCGGNRRFARDVLRLRGYKYYIVSANKVLLEKVITAMCFANPDFADKITTFPAYVGRYGGVLTKTNINVNDYVKREPFRIASVRLDGGTKITRIEILYYPDEECDKTARKFYTHNKINITMKEGSSSPANIARITSVRDWVVDKHPGVVFIVLYYFRYHVLLYDIKDIGPLYPILELFMPPHQLQELCLGDANNDSDIDDSDTENADWLDGTHV